MNTSKVGETFEQEMLGFFDQLIRNGHFMFLPEACKLYHQKGYYSRERESDIIFDIAIEVYRPGETTFTFRILIECKKYAHPVPVSDVEEFLAKVRQVGSANTKAIMVTSNAFQEGGIRYARANGIGLLRYFQADNFKWVLNRSPASLHATVPASRVDVLEGMVSEAYRSPYYDIYACAGETHTHSLSEFLLALVGRRWASLRKITKPAAARRMVRFLSTKEIEDRAIDVLAGIGYAGGRVPLELILKREQVERGLAYSLEPRREDAGSRPVLGEISFSPPKITLFEECPAQSLRQRFTLAHELGHYFLDHGRYMIREARDSEDDLEQPPRLPALCDVQRLEAQANHFAACLLLPRAHFVRDFFSETIQADIVDRGHGVLYVDSQHCNLESYHRITNMLRWEYGASRSVIRLRLLGLQLLNEDSAWRNAAYPWHGPAPLGPAPTVRSSVATLRARFDFRRIIQESYETARHPNGR